MSSVERLGLDVLLEDPQVEAAWLWARYERLGRQSEQTRPDAPPLSSIGDVEVVEQRAPRRVVVKEGIYEADRATVLREDRATSVVRLP